ncbi:MAG: citrate/2-methylcitrate synthase [Acutalibacteraceae bacterium]|nr:citrate/2-methylcitrate synthase [Acutalibacteraceae bacterium]
MNYSENTSYIKELADLSNSGNHIVPEMYPLHNVKRGLRDIDGNGVVAGLTEISYIKAKDKDSDGNAVPCKGELYYRGINIKDIVKGFVEENRFGFEETMFLLLFSKLPDEKELLEFREQLSVYRSLPPSFVRDMILKAPGKDMMNILSRCVLALYTYDENPDDISVDNVVRQCLQLISELPMIAVYAYHSFQHYHNNNSLFIHYPKKDLTIAENILYMLREDGKFTQLEAKLLDLALVLHAEHGGGNNSTFTTHVVTSSGTDTYSAISAALGSLKGPRHGGANIKVVQMFDDMKASINTKNEQEIKDYLGKLLDKQAFDKAGLIYGMGHAVYSLSDPRADILRTYAEQLSKEKGMEDEFRLYEFVEKNAPQIIADKRKIYKGVSANVDFYSGMVYKMLNLPNELFTPIFAVARIVGWSAHRIEEIQNAGKIIRPAYINVKDRFEYIPLNER